MDFLERIFGYSPDGGSGMLELLIIAILAISLALVYLAARSARKKT